MNDEPVAWTSESDSQTKAPYVRPQLVVYGDLRTITASRKKSGADGASGSSSFSR
jgi:hypothetical protein